MAEELVYLLQGGPYYKIGRTKNLMKRMRVIQTSQPHTLVVVHTWQVDNGVQVERFLHRKFASVKMHGEWFQLAQSEVEALMNVKEWHIETSPPKPEKIPFVHEMPGPIGNLLISKGITRPIEFARKTGLSRQYAHALWSGDRLVSRKMARRLAPILEVSPEILVMLERPTK